jgi:hypothetical protein
MNADIDSMLDSCSCVLDSRALRALPMGCGSSKVHPQTTGGGEQQNSKALDKQLQRERKDDAKTQKLLLLGGLHVKSAFGACYHGSRGFLVVGGTSSQSVSAAGESGKTTFFKQVCQCHLVCGHLRRVLLVLRGLQEWLSGE